MAPRGPMTHFYVIWPGRNNDDKQIKIVAAILSKQTDAVAAVKT